MKLLFLIGISKVTGRDKSMNDFAGLPWKEHAQKKSNVWITAHLKNELWNPRRSEFPSLKDRIRRNPKWLEMRTKIVCETRETFLSSRELVLLHDFPESLRSWAAWKGFEKLKCPYSFGKSPFLPILAFKAYLGQGIWPILQNVKRFIILFRNFPYPTISALKNRFQFYLFKMLMRHIHRIFLW